MNICLLPLILHLSSQITKENGDSLWFPIVAVVSLSLFANIKSKLCSICGSSCLRDGPAVMFRMNQRVQYRIAPLDVTVGAKDESSTITGSSSVDHLLILVLAKYTPPPHHN